MEQGCFMVDHVSYLARAYNIPPRLVVNSDQTRIHLVPITKECMWKTKTTNMFMYLELKIRSKSL